MNLNLYTENMETPNGWVLLINPSNDKDRFSFPIRQHLKITESGAKSNTELVFYVDEIGLGIFRLKLFGIQTGCISGFAGIRNLWSGKNCVTVGRDEFSTYDNLKCTIVQQDLDLQSMNAEFWRAINNGYDCVIEYTTVKLFEQKFFDILLKSLQNGNVQKSNQL